MPRQYTDLLIEATQNEYLTKEQMFDALMCYLSEDEVKEFCLTSNDRDTAWTLAEMKGNQDGDFSNHEELESEWKYVKEQS